MLPKNYIILTGRPFKSGASWSEDACDPRRFLAVHSQLLIAAQGWLLYSTVCSSRSSAGAGAATARCVAACMELLPWRWVASHNSSAGHSSLMEGTSSLMIWMAMRH